MKIGYACKTVAVPETQLQSCKLANATEERIIDIIKTNLSALKNTLLYNVENGILMFRISSDIIPFATYPGKTLSWHNLFKDTLLEIAEIINKNNMRVSMHPGQYTVLNSPNEDVYRRAVEDLTYHCDFLDAITTNSEHKIILHIGGVYGNKKEAVQRFLEKYNLLSTKIKNRLVIENDDVSFNVSDVIEISNQANIPVVFDNLHHQINNDPTFSQNQWLRLCRKTWKKDDGIQKIHYSQQAYDKKTGSHSESIRISEFLDFYESISDLDIDIMLEVKDKNLSAVKCLNSTKFCNNIPRLEKEWSIYKYSVLEHSPEIYNNIRALFRENSSSISLKFYSLLEEALSAEIKKNNAINAIQHVWGYFKSNSTEKEKLDFMNKLTKFENGSIKINNLKKTLWEMSIKYNQQYLLHANYYFLT